MKIYLVIILALLLTGCSNVKDEINTEELNKDLLAYEMEYNTHLYMDRKILATSEGPLFDIGLNNTYNHYFMQYINGEATIMNSDPNNGCNFGKIEKCTSYFDGELFSDFFYLNDMIYYVDFQGDAFYLSRCELDGTNRENIMKYDFENPSDNGVIATGIAYGSPTFSIHQGVFYVTEMDKIYMYNLIDGETNIIECETDLNITKIYLYDDIAYLVIGDYDETRLLKVELNTYEQEVMYEDLQGNSIVFVDENNIIFFETIGNHIDVILQNHDTKEKVVLFDLTINDITVNDGEQIDWMVMPSINVLKEQDKYMLHVYDHNSENSTGSIFGPQGLSFINVYDEQGKPLKQISFDGISFELGVIDGIYYITIDDKGYCLDLNSDSDELVEMILG